MSQATLLYVEDNALNTQLIKKMLKFSPYTIIDAATGKSGLVMAQLYKPDLILTDINLPDIDGLELIATLKSHPMLKEIPIVALTADLSPHMHDRCVAAGCIAYLTKPISKTGLLKVLQQSLTSFQPF